MKNRHLLLRRQRILSPRLLRRQPLVSYIVRQHMLADTLGLAEPETTQVKPTADGAAQPWWPLPADRLPVFQSEQMESEQADELNAPFVSAQTLPLRAPEPNAAPSTFSGAPLPEDEQIIQTEYRAPFSPVEVASQPESVQAASELDEAQEQAKPVQVELDAQDEWLESAQVAQEPREAQKQPGPARIERYEQRARSRPAQVEKREQRESPGQVELRRSERARITELRASDVLNPLPAFAQEENERIGKETLNARDADVLSSLPLQSTPVVRETVETREASEVRPPVAQTGAELFASRGTDRSPQAWLARLNRSAQKEAQEARSTSAPAPRETRKRGPASGNAEPVTQSARAFLKPLLGIDPASVPVYRDAQAEAATASEQADALSDGETIELAAEHSAQTPATLGLLAHELTHVLRRQNPRFLPPIVRALPGPTWETRDEEALALQVERQTRRIARGDSEIPTTNTARPVKQGESESEANVAPPDPARPIWGNLPAPWEPLPEWLATMPESAGMIPPPLAELPIVSAPPAPMLATSTNLSEGAPAIQRAGLERSLEEPESENVGATGSHSQSEPARVPEPDLDAMAQQVYALLKRRLGVEQRRAL